MMCFCYFCSAFDLNYGVYLASSALFTIHTDKFLVSVEIGDIIACRYVLYVFRGISAHISPARSNDCADCRIASDHDT